MASTPEGEKGRERGGGWVEKVVPERRKAIRRLLKDGLTHEQAEAFVREAIAVCHAQDERPDDPRAFFRGVLKTLNWVVEEVLPQKAKAIRKLAKDGLTQEQAEDLVSQAILVCWRQDERPENPGAFFRSVVEKLKNRYLRKEKPRLARTESLAEDHPSEDPTPLQRAWHRECREEMEAALDTLPERVAEVAWLHLEGMKLAEIARALGRSASTVRTQWATAKPVLEELIERLGLGT